MMAQLHNLIDTLREELEQYGEMLALLDQQQEIGQQRGADTLLHCASALNVQSATILSARQHRLECQRQLAQALNLPSEASCGSLLPILPEPYRPLISALIQENTDLLARVRQRAQQNQLWLQRSAEVMQQFIAKLTPQPHSADAAEEEEEPLTPPASPRLYQAIA